MDFHFVCMGMHVCVWCMWLFMCCFCVCVCDVCVLRCVCLFVCVCVCVCVCVRVVVVGLCNETCGWRCYGPDADNCCHPNCAVGCTGPGPQDCMVCSSVCLSVCVSVHLSVCVSLHLSRPSCLSVPVFQIGKVKSWSSDIIIGQAILSHWIYWSHVQQKTDLCHRSTRKECKKTVSCGKFMEHIGYIKQHDFIVLSGNSKHKKV